MLNALCAGFNVVLEKSEFFLSQISFLGYIVTVDGLKPDPRKVAAVQEAPAPVTLTQVRAFLGLASYYRRFIKGFASVAKPLTNLLKKEEQLIWTSECEAAFQALKEALTSAPVLARSDPTRPFALYTDWQPQAISAVLTHDGADQREHVIEYASKTLSQAQANYEACKGECLAVVWGIQHFRPYLYGQKFVLMEAERTQIAGGMEKHFGKGGTNEDGGSARKDTWLVRRWRRSGKRWRSLETKAIGTWLVVYKDEGSRDRDGRRAKMARETGRGEESGGDKNDARTRTGEERGNNDDGGRDG
ncbi:hypothetical protein CBR_g4621 [Chara braunii]|uniref:Reverse transcriptase/retrotransposon-derived protein RNase H-like domain-containing protein n=1 Tax=Chara braunii TaxID=69332 RepID=A0A388KIB2_CHABU|nr:hypothetical protein CBR_g4621 [Chara braunii]|eukprot:GBG69791.1 hypothetical protein CBR_g4621 [Chara braunii]